ncbi:hypothetical protein BDV28DRAFT_112154 [Aspergillus coremiiformis]|uniref:Lysozyme-like domain-containing protein n=1 Tax=Aspergillus coremiiformis TaxID=138285 RepID=A0A5N6YRR3_9EURO|nr:hypothetical protein BDV28DRAFT_112154 [Aspergillus coremiiformis]
MQPTSFVNTLCFLLPWLASAAPAPPMGQDVCSSNKTITVQQIMQIAPKAATVCDKEKYPECATAQEATDNINKSFDKYGVTSLAEKAAVISLIALESVEFLYNRNKVPGIVGQGTRNMQWPEYNAKYAQSLPDIKDKAQQVSGDKAKVLDLLVSNIEYDFGSAAWFLTTQCSNSVREALKKNPKEGWTGYIEQCVQTTVSPDRRTYWNRTTEALGL